MKIVTVAQMKELERRALKSDMNEGSLMESAGLAVARKLAEIVGGIRSKRVVVLVGSGNNGGDGMVAARIIANWGGLVTIYMTDARRREDKFNQCRAEHIRIIEGADDITRLQLIRYVSTADIIVDAVLGIGNDRPLSDSLRMVFKELVNLKQEHPALNYVALDMPSGLQADTGEADETCFPANMTLTLGAPKIGLYCFPGAAYAGHVEILNIGFPGGIDDGFPMELCDHTTVANLVPKRPLDGHKGSFGSVLVVAGSRQFVGAPLLATTAAYRTGAGLVTLAAPETASRLAGPRLAEQVHLPLPETSDGYATANAGNVLRTVAESSSSLVIGPGLGNVESIRQLLTTLLLTEPHLMTPCVIDADALNALSQTYRWWESLKAPAVLTPHPGEMGRLLSQPVSSVQSNRIETAQHAAYEWGQVIVLKGAYTVVASPGGMTAVSPFANPALASAGTGDVLSGIVGALLAQGLKPYEAAKLGVHIHAAAAQRVSERIGSSGLLASDLFTEIPVAVHHLRQSPA